MIPNEFLRSWGRADDGAFVEIAVLDGTERHDQELRDRWPPVGLARCAPPDRPADLLVAVGIETAGSPSDQWDQLESQLALFAAERLAGQVAIHAALIVHDGAALLLPGTSGAGKSTLCVAAAAAGAHVLTDEYALADLRTGLVSGWRRPVRVRRPEGGVERRDLAVSHPPVAVRLVAQLDHQPGPSVGWAPISAAAAVRGLLANTVCARSRPDEALDAAVTIAHSAHTVEGTRGEADDALAALLTVLHGIG